MKKAFLPYVSTLRSLVGVLLIVCVSPSVAASETKRNIKYIANSKTPVRHMLDVHYDPATIKKAKPVIFWVHGGAWKFGNKTHAIEPKKKAFIDAGYVLVSANYRFVPKVTFKEQTQDLARALAWVKTNIAKHGGDSQQIVLMGHSAGAHLVALLGADHTYLKDAGVELGVIKGVIPLDGCGYDIPLQIKIGGVMSQRTYKQVFTSDVEKQKKASPVTYVKKGVKYPPFLIIVCKSRKDAPVQAEQFAEKLKGVNANAEVMQAKDKTHLSLNRELGTRNDPPTLKVLAFLKKVTKAK
eukprot:Seg16521.1 transcript_id=Seg16521.1/GoldUCD/mRNA.D3Y31 product="Isoprenylcysteine alpha-carbonyl methylesterase ICME" protein_id=Seg16521.1/GoldUCD/D3Y31